MKRTFTTKTVSYSHGKSDSFITRWSTQGNPTENASESDGILKFRRVFRQIFFVGKILRNSVGISKFHRISTHIPSEGKAQFPKKIYIWLLSSAMK